MTRPRAYTSSALNGGISEATHQIDTRRARGSSSHICGGVRASNHCRRGARHIGSGVTWRQRRSDQPRAHRENTFSGHRRDWTVPDRYAPAGRVCAHLRVDRIHHGQAGQRDRLRFRRDSDQRRAATRVAAGDHHGLRCIARRRYADDETRDGHQQRDDQFASDHAQLRRRAVCDPGIGRSTRRQCECPDAEHGALLGTRRDQHGGTRVR